MGHIYSLLNAKDVLCFQVVGYVTQYNVNSFKYVVIKGAGHMVSYVKGFLCGFYWIQVPEDKPEAAFEMFQRFIKDIDY